MPKKKNNSVLITGASGMVGSNLQVSFSNNNIKFLSPSSKTLNLLDKKSIHNYFKKHRFNYIVHCAGLVGGIKKNLNNQIDFYKSNLEMGYNLFNLANNFKIDNIINLGSSCMYPNNYKRSFLEKDLLSGPIEETNYGYALSKINNALYLKMLRLETKRNYSTIIPPNLYGYFDNFSPESSHLIQSIIVKCIDAKRKNKKEIIIWGSGKAKREFLFTSDLTDYISFVIKNNIKLPDLINIGYGKDFFIKELYDFVQKALNTNFTYTFDKKKPTGIFRKLINSNLAKKKYYWQPKTEINNGILKVINFYKNKYEV